MIASLRLIDRGGDAVTRRGFWHRTPALGIGTLVTLATCPGSTHRLELTVDQRAVGIAGLSGCITQMRAWCLYTCFEIDEGRRAVVPVDRSMRARVETRVAVTHGEG